MNSYSDGSASTVIISAACSAASGSSRTRFDVIGSMAGQIICPNPGSAQQAGLPTPSSGAENQ